MPSMKFHFDKWTGLVDISRLGSGCAICEAAPPAPSVSQPSILTQNVVNLKSLESGDRFVVEGLERVREVLRRQGDMIVTKDIINMATEEMPLNVKVVKVGHRTTPNTICDGLPKDTKKEMITTSINSWDNFYVSPSGEPGVPVQTYRSPREAGAVITSDNYMLGEIKEGSRNRVDIPRKGTNIEGTFHTHPGGSTEPGDFDLIDMLGHNDKLQCICATGEAGTKCQCYTPHEPVWTEVRRELNNLLDDIRKYNKATHSRYGLKGKSLRKLLRGIATEAYLRSGIPAEVTRIPGGMGEGGGLKPLETRRVIGEKPITIAEKQALIKEYQEAVKQAEEFAKELGNEQAKLTDLLDRIREANSSVESLKSGIYITIYNLDQISDPAGIQALRDKAGKYSQGFIPSELPIHYYAFGDADKFEQVSMQISQVNSQIANIQGDINDLFKIGGLETVEQINRRMIQRAELIDRMGDLYQERDNLRSLQWAYKPIEISPSSQNLIILVDETEIPLAQNEAATNITPISKEYMIELIDKRAEEIRAKESSILMSIATLQRNIEILVGTSKNMSFTDERTGKTVFLKAMSGGRAQQYREIIRDKTKKAFERHQAGAELDKLDDQASRLKRDLKAARDRLKISRRPGPGVEVRRYSPEIEALMERIVTLTHQVQGIATEVNRKHIMANEAQDKAQELKAEIDILAKNRTTEYNEAVKIMQEGQNLENRRQLFLNKIRGYARQSGIFPEDLYTVSNRLFDSCRIIWEQETLDIVSQELDVEKLVRNLTSARTVKIKATGETGILKGVHEGVYTVQVGATTKELSAEDIDFFE